MARSPPSPSCLPPCPALHTLLTCLWGCSPYKMVSVLLVLFPLPPGLSSHLPKDINLRPSACRNLITRPLPPQRGQSSWPLSPVEEDTRWCCCELAGGAPQPVSSVSSLPVPVAGVLHSWGEHGVQGGLAQPHSRSPLCVPCLVTRAEEKFLENYNFVS